MIEQHLFRLFTALSDSKQVQLELHGGYSSVQTKGSTWPRFVFDVHISEGIIEEISKGIQSKKLPNALILDAGQAQFHEQALLGQKLIPVELWPCLSMTAMTLKPLPQPELAMEIQQVQTEEQWAQWLRVASAGFGKLSRHVFAPPNIGQMFFYLGFVKGKPAASAMLFIADGVAGIYHMVTLPAFRKMGLGTTLFRHCQQTAMGLGASEIVTQSTSSAINAWIKTGMKEQGDLYLFMRSKR